MQRTGDDFDAQLADAVRALRTAEPEPWDSDAALVEVRNRADARQRQRTILTSASCATLVLAGGVVIAIVAGSPTSNPSSAGRSASQSSAVSDPATSSKAPSATASTSGQDVGALTPADQAETAARLTRAGKLDPGLAGIRFTTPNHFVVYRKGDRTADTTKSYERAATPSATVSFASAVLTRIEANDVSELVDRNQSWLRGNGVDLEGWGPSISGPFRILYLGSTPDAALLHRFERYGVGTVNFVRAPQLHDLPGDASSLDSTSPSR